MSVNSGSEGLVISSLHKDTTHNDDETPNEVPTSTEEYHPLHLKNLTLEPILIVYFFAITLTSNTTTNLYLDRACLLNLNQSQEVCNDLSNYTDIENQAQVISNNYGLYSSLIKLLPSAIISVFIGPWSDKFGRIPPMYISLLGSIFCDIGMIVYALTPDSPIYQTLLYAIPQGLCGEKIVFLACVYTIATEKTPVLRRPIKYAIMELCFGMGAIIAPMVAGLIYDKYGYVPVYCVTLGCHFVIAVYVFFVVRDDSEKQSASLKTKFIEFFSCDSFKENINTALKKRENYGRAQICTLCISMSIIVLSISGSTEVLFLFCKKMYHWNLPQYSMINTITSLVGVGIMVVVVPLLTKVFKVQDHWLGLLGVASLMAQSIVRAFAYSTWMYYAGVAVGLFLAVTPLAVRSKLSRAVETHELGKLFSLLSTMEYLFPVLGSLIYTQVYNASIDFFPGLTFLVGGTTLIFPFVVFVWLVRLNRASYSALKNVQSTEVDEKNALDDNSVEI